MKTTVLLRTLRDEAVKIILSRQKSMRKISRDGQCTPLLPPTKLSWQDKKQSKAEILTNNLYLEDEIKTIMDEITKPHSHIYNLKKILTRWLDQMVAHRMQVASLPAWWFSACHKARTSWTTPDPHKYSLNTGRHQGQLLGGRKLSLK